jgi:hypothetical protein
MMKPLLGILTTACVIFHPTVFAMDAALGQRLFSQSKCLECHSAESFMPPQRKVQNLQQLEQKVRQCDANLSTNWFDDEILAVVNYLNQTYYQFPAPSAGITPTPQVTTSLTANVTEFFAR